jgi:hypothetical protein
MSAPSARLRGVLAISVVTILLACPTTPPPSTSSDTTPAGFVTVMVTMLSGTTVAVGPIDLNAATATVGRTGVPASVGTIRVVATAGDPQSGISNIVINGTATSTCGHGPGTVIGAPTQEPLKFTPLFTPATPPSTPAVLTATATPIVQSTCPVPAPAGFTLSTVQGTFTVTATSAGGSTMTQSFSYLYADF